MLLEGATCIYGMYGKHLKGSIKMLCSLNCLEFYHLFSFQNVFFVNKTTRLVLVNTKIA